MNKETILKDTFASIVVVLVALPLAMGIALASGMPPASGLITCIVGGIVVGLLSGSPLQVSGPAAGLSVIVYDILREHGAEKIGLIVLIAGLVQLAAGLLKWGQWFRAVSPAVINGMLSGIGVLILGSQFHVMLDDKPRTSGWENLIEIPRALWNLQQMDISNPHIAGGIGLLTIVVILVWEAGAPKKLKLIPAALLAVLAASAVTYYFKLPINHVQLPENLLEAIRVPTSGWNGWRETNILLEGLALAIVASAETLLTATAVDRMQTRVRAKYDRELAAQGVGNTICGLLGALPMTGVIVRSTVNIQAGAQTRLSPILHGIWLLLFVLAFPWVLRLIPTAALAALLVYTGYKLANWKVFFELKKYGKSEAVIYLVTLITIVATDLLTGVLTGLALSIAKLLYIFSHLEIREDTQSGGPGQTALYLRGAATFLNLPRLADALESVEPSTELHVHLEDLDYIDHASLDLIMSWEESHKASGGALVIDWGTLGTMFRERRRAPRQTAPVATAGAATNVPATVHQPNENGPVATSSTSDP